MAAPAYSYSRSQRVAAPRRERVAPRPERRPDVRVVPGSGRRTATQVLPQNTVTIAVAIAFVMIVLAMVCIVRIGLTSAAATTAMSTDEISSALSQARSASSTLEVQSTNLGRSERIKTEATKLGMYAPYETTTIVLSEDVVATSEDGSLSLGESLRRATSTAAAE